MYNKLFTKILDSSIWLEPQPTRIVFITLLAAMDEDGYAHFSAIENLASRARVSVTQCNTAVQTLSEPDPNSCDPEFQGRRIERVPGGFMILNAKKYKSIADSASRREATRSRVQKFREKKALDAEKKNGNTDVTRQALHTVSEYVSVSELSLQGESEGKRAQGPELIYAEYPKKVARRDAIAAIKKAMAVEGFTELLAKTRAYALAVAGKDRQFIPHPATWFNRESYNDDPKDWNAETKQGATEDDHKGGF
jgi:hypothetical protein